MGGIWLGPHCVGCDIDMFCRLGGNWARIRALEQVAREQMRAEVEHTVPVRTLQLSPERVS